MNIWTNWKTTSTGIAMILGAIVALVFTKPLDATTINASIVAILAGIGLIFAKDSNVTGGTTVAK